MNEVEMIERLVRIETRFADFMEHVVEPMAVKVDDIHEKLNHNGIVTKVDSLIAGQEMLSDKYDKLESVINTTESKYPMVNWINKVPVKLILTLLVVLLASMLGIDIKEYFIK